MIQRCSDTEIQRYRDTEIQRYRDTEIYRYRDTEIQRNRDTEIQRGKKRYKLIRIFFCIFFNTWMYLIRLYPYFVCKVFFFFLRL